MFKFGFSIDNDTETDVSIKTTKIPQINWFKSEEISIKPTEINRYNKIQEIRIDDLLIKHYLIDEIVEKIKEKDCGNDLILNAEQNHSDLITGVYEGGSKIWECTYDLLDYLTKNRVDFNNSQVLDLGCGTGILGIFASLNGASCSFQDYNVEVVKNITIPNVYLNIGESTSRFYSGDWESFGELLGRLQDKFDLILTSETIYNRENYQKLHDTFATLLKPTGTIFLAAKQYYFGVGGNLAEFLQILETNNIFTSTTIWECSTGVKRSIIKINFK